MSAPLARYCFRRLSSDARLGVVASLLSAPQSGLATAHRPVTQEEMRKRRKPRHAPRSTDVERPTIVNRRARRAAMFAAEKQAADTDTGTSARSSGSAGPAQCSGTGERVFNPWRPVKSGSANKQPQSAPNPAEPAIVIHAHSSRTWPSKREQIDAKRSMMRERAEEQKEIDEEIRDEDDVDTLRERHSLSRPVDRSQSSSPHRPARGNPERVKTLRAVREKLARLEDKSSVDARRTRPPRVTQSLQPRRPFVAHEQPQTAESAPPKPHSRTSAIQFVARYQSNEELAAIDDEEIELENEIDEPVVSLADELGVTDNDDADDDVDDAEISTPSPMPDTTTTTRTFDKIIPNIPSELNGAPLEFNGLTMAFEAPGAITSRIVTLSKLTSIPIQRQSSAHCTLIVSPHGRHLEIEMKKREKKHFRPGGKQPSDREGNEKPLYFMWRNGLKQGSERSLDSAALIRALGHSFTNADAGTRSGGEFPSPLTGVSVLDVGGGFGFDSYSAAIAGAAVHSLERQPAIYALTAFFLDQFQHSQYCKKVYKQRLEQLHYLHCDSRAVLETLVDDIALDSVTVSLNDGSSVTIPRPDVVLIDLVSYEFSKDLSFGLASEFETIFTLAAPLRVEPDEGAAAAVEAPAVLDYSNLPPSSKSRRSRLRTMLQNEEELLALARVAARRSVVVKREKARFQQSNDDMTSAEPLTRVFRKRNFDMVVYESVTQQQLRFNGLKQSITDQTPSAV